MNTASGIQRASELSLMSPSDRIRITIEALPILSRKDLQNLDDDSCPICLMSLASILIEEAQALETDSAPDVELGVTKLVGCGHIFCRRDLTEWIRSMHGSCPTCRYVFLDIRQPSESDDESSDGGEYIPNEDDDEEDGFLDTDGFSEADEFDVEMDLESDEIWDEDEFDDIEPGLGLSDGDTASEEGVSSADDAMEFEEEEETNIGVVESDGEIDVAGEDSK